MELVRLANLLLRSIPATEVAGPDGGRSILRQGMATRADGRRLDVFHFCHSDGAPVVWLQSTLGFFMPTRAGEAEMRRCRMRIIVPIRAGFGGSTPMPEGCDVIELSAADTLAFTDRCRIDRTLLVALADDIRIALAIAYAAPERVGA